MRGPVVPNVSFRRSAANSDSEITLDAAKWLAEGKGAMLIGGDQLSLETYEYGRPDLTVPVHNYLLNQRGLAIIQVDNLDQLAADGVYEFAVIAAPLRTGGAAALQFRPLAFPLGRGSS